MFPKAIQNIISNYQILGFIPLDKTLHLVVGGIITIVLRQKKVKIGHVFIFLILLGMLKEFIDSFSYTSTWTENFLDVLATITYPIILLAVIKLKNILSKEN